MFGRLVRSLVGGGDRTPAPPRAPAPRASGSSGGARVEDIFSIPSPPLRTLFRDRHDRPVGDHESAARESHAACTAALAGDPMTVGLALIQRAPIMKALMLTQNGDGLRRLDYVFQAACEAARRAIVERCGPELPIADRDLPFTLHALGVLVSQGVHDFHWSYGTWFEPVVRTAARSHDPAVRQALVAMFNVCGQGNDLQRDQAVAVVERLLPLTGIPRGAVQLLALKDGAAEVCDAARARIRADAGELLWAAIEAALDNLPGTGAYSLRDAERQPALKALTDQSPAERGSAFHTALDIIANFPRYGFEHWGVLERHNGAYRIGGFAQPHLRGIGNIVGALACRKMELADPDGDAARLVALLRHYVSLDHRRILAFLLDVARAHPYGRTVPALRALVATEPTSRYFAKWATEIEDMLRDLPAAEAPAPAAARASVPVAGFGRKGSAPAAASAATSPLRGLPPIELPDFPVNRFTSRTEIVTHFDALFEARLYDAPHREFLADLAALADGVDGLTGDRATQAEGTIALASSGGRRLHADHDRIRTASVIADVARLGRDFHQRFEAFAPFVTTHPEAARTLGKLAAGIATKSAPTAKWLAEGQAILAAVPGEERLAMLRMLVEAPTPLPGIGGGEQYLRALLYLSIDLDPAAIGPMLTDYALRKCYVTVPGLGIRSEKLGNAALWTLAAIPDGAGVPYLARILARTKYPKIRARIDEKLNEAATAAGLSRGALDELTVPTHGLDRDGTLSAPLGGGEAVIRVRGARDVTVEWLSETGKPLKSPSVAMKADKEALKEVRDAAKEIEADLGALLVRVQRLYLDDRSWPAAEWRDRYLDHPLVRTLARRLIWWVEAPDGPRTAAIPGPAGEEMLDAAGNPVPLDGATIRLWHPIEAAVAEVEAWRDRLEALEVVQPFAQAWREVYALTDAERATGTYTNRWAAHILKQHQAMTLARLNGWRVTHRMWVDAPNDEPWHLTLPAHNLVADYWVHGTGGESPEVTDSCAFVYVSTDRVQFHAVEDCADSARGPARLRAVPLTDIPPLIFSEVMRQADLFTAVASIAADPNWLDRGGDAAHPSQWGNLAVAYWNSANTAELEESGKRRRAMLERIVPRLAIAAKLKLDERYLLVEGTRHAYRIHLGSGACFRGERHLCIVPKAPETGAGGGRIWLPFEGDRTLSIILSKALLLAADDRITDPVILRQL